MSEAGSSPDSERDTEPSPANTMAERAGTNRVKLWLLVEADRWLVVLLLLSALFAALVAVGVLVPGAAARLASGDPVETLFQALVGATVTGVTLVLTLNQLVLSQELGGAGDQRDRMESALGFRADVADVVDRPTSPPEPSDFLHALVTAADDAAAQLRDAAESGGPAEFRERATDLVEDVSDNAATVTGELQDAQFGTFDVVSAALNFNYSWKLFAARRLQAEFDGDLDETADDALAELVDVLELFGPAREHVKTLYVRWELVDLSRAVLWSALPALVTAVAVLSYLPPDRLTGSLFGLPTSVVAVSAAVTVTLLPFAVLLSYILRIATVAKRTLSIGPFTLRQTSRTEGEE